MIDETLPRETVIINRFDSRCNNCGKPCLPSDGSHLTIVGYGKDNGEPGCLIEWEYSASDYFGMQEVIQEQWPDLKWVGYEPAWPAAS